MAKGYRSSEVRKGRDRHRVAKPVHTFATSAREGASLVAPTAPHGTTADPAAEPSGPTRFWSRRRVSNAFRIAVVASIAIHCSVSPFNLFPSDADVEFKDVEGELTIPIDILGAEDIAPPVADNPPAQTPPATPNAAGLGGPDGGVRDAGPSDGGRDASPPKPPSDGGANGASDAGARDAGAEAGSPKAVKDGYANVITGGEVNVNLFLDVDVIRSHPIGKKLGPLLGGIPQWREFLHGAETGFDPVRDTNWIQIYGPSLIKTERDAVHIHYSAPDEVIDKALELMSQNTPDGGPFETGVPGVRATLGFADNAQRVILRVRPGEAIIVPPANAVDFAKVLQKNPVVPKRVPGEAVRLVVKNPSHQIAIKGLKFPDSLKEIDLRALPQKDGSAKVLMQGICSDEAAAADVQEVMAKIIKGLSGNMAIRLAGLGTILDNAELTQNGKTVDLNATATQQQLASILALIATQMNVTLPPD